MKQKSRTFTEITFVLQNNVDCLNSLSLCPSHTTQNPSARTAQYLPLIFGNIIQTVNWGESHAVYCSLYESVLKQGLSDVMTVQRSPAHMIRTTTMMMSSPALS